MSLSAAELGLYALALFVLFLTPGPVWVALVARALSGGFNAAWPLALGVVVGDVLWPLLAILGLGWLVAAHAGFLVALKAVAAAVFIGMGVLLIRHPQASLAADSRLTRPGMWAGFVAGLAVILGNPKAILFYMGVLPGFFDLSQVTGWDIAAISAISAAVPFCGNLILAAFMGRVRRFLSTPGAVRRTNRAAGAVLVVVGLALPFV